MKDSRRKKLLQMIAIAVMLILAIAVLGFIQGIILEHSVIETTTTSPRL